MEDPYITVGPDPSGEADSYYVAADQLSLGRLKPCGSEGEWVLTSLRPASFQDVSFVVADTNEAHQKAMGLLAGYLENEGSDLFGDDED